MKEISTDFSKSAPVSEKIVLTVQGHKVTLYFAAEKNHTVSALIKKALLGSYLQEAQRTVSG